jgi:predicted kinase
MKLIMTRGLPASGKSTWAKELVTHENGSYKRLNRDELRLMIDNGKWSKHNEKFIIEVEKLLALQYLNSSVHVIIDDTNLSKDTEYMWRNVAIEAGADFEIKDFTNVPLSECIKRDQKRPNYVGEKVIKKMYNVFLLKLPNNPNVTLNHPLQECWIFDLDGTLALHTLRGPYEEEKCESDTVNESVRSILNTIKQPRNVFLVSGRHESVRPQTERWLKFNEIEYTKLYMRQNHDSRPDNEVKREVYFNNIFNKYRVMGWFDDRLRVCREIHNLKLPLFRVGDPDADF